MKNRNSRVVQIGVAILVLSFGWIGFSAQRRFRFERMMPVVPESPRELYLQPGEPEFIFARMMYTGLRPWPYGKNWDTDWPKSDLQFILGIQRLTNIRAAQEGAVVQLTDPNLYQYPFLYSVECGHWNLTDEEVLGLREYLRRGGFLFCDDFWGSWEWDNFRENILRVLPEARISDIPMDHPVFHSYYDIEELIQTPYYENAIYGLPTYEQDGYTPYCRGIFDEHDRLMVIINWNTDLGDSWEWADDSRFPPRYSTYAYQIGINAIVYAMSH